MENIFGKKMQSVYKAIYAEGIKESWKDEHMQEYCIKCNCLFVPFRANTIIVGLEKPYIQKDFWFGYSDFGQGPTFDECNNAEDNARRNAIDYFMKSNLKPIDNDIKKITELIENKNFSYYNYYFNKHYYSESETNPVSTIVYFDKWQDREKYEKNFLTAEELKLYLEALKEYRNMFIKRLNTYLKRFGVSKLHFGTYWMDR